MNMNFFNFIKEFFASAFKYVQTNLEKIVKAVTNLFTNVQEPVPTDPIPPDERPTVPEPVITDPPKQLNLIAIWNVY
jgi:hypothetical protein